MDSREANNKCDDCCPVVRCEACGPCARHDDGVVLVDEDGLTSCCHAYTSIFIDDQVEYCKGCYRPVTGYIGSAVFDMPVAVDSVFGVRNGCCDDYALYPEEAAALERLVVVPYLGRTDIPVDAEVLSDARNMLDTYTLSSECDGNDDERCAAFFERRDGEPDKTCDFCTWCQSLILRDWCDQLFDRANYTPPGYIDRVDYDVAATYQNIWASVNAQYKATQPRGDHDHDRSVPQRCARWLRRTVRRLARRPRRP